MVEKINSKEEILEKEVVANFLKIVPKIEDLIEKKNWTANDIKNIADFLELFENFYYVDFFIKNKKKGKVSDFQKEYPDFDEIKNLAESLAAPEK